MSGEIHALTDRDLEARTGTCSVCGPVKIAPSGNGWACGTRQAERNRRWRKRHPERRPSTNPHRLSWHRDGHGLCVLCGPSTVVPWGRGWICVTRATELGRVNQQSAPAPYCLDCKDDDGKIIPLTDGECWRCAQSLNQQFANQRELGQQVHGGDLDAAYTIIGIPDPYEMPEYESAVPGWRTIGSRTAVATAG